MTRPIKFRAWEKEEKLMCCVLEMEFDTEELIKVGIGYPDGVNSSLRYPTMIELMQFTGLLDKNGREIYEGDLLRRSDGVIGVVEWDEKEAGFMTRVVKGSGGGYYEQKEEEVIGNIYSNPELIN